MNIFMFYQNIFFQMFYTYFYIPHSLKLSSVGESWVHLACELYQQIEQFSIG